MKKYIIGFILLGALGFVGMVEAQGVRLPWDTKQRLKSELRAEVTAEIGDSAATALKRNAFIDSVNALSVIDLTGDSLTIKAGGIEQLIVFDDSVTILNKLNVDTIVAGDVAVRGNLTVEGDFREATNAHVELSTTDSATTAVTGGTFRGLSNLFETTRIAEFTAYTDTLVYDGADSLIAGWIFGVSMSSGDANNQARFQLFINSTSVGNPGFMVREFKSANAEGFMGGNGIIALGNGDSLWVHVTDITTATWGVEAFHFTVFEIDKFE